ncbi:hypothetical protein KI387_001315, partial [Taxus chinensis]
MGWSEWVYMHHFIFDIFFYQTLEKYLHLCTFCFNMPVANKRHGYPCEAVTSFHQTRTTGVQSDQLTFTSILLACAENGAAASKTVSVYMQRKQWLPRGSHLALSHHEDITRPRINANSVPTSIAKKRIRCPIPSLNTHPLLGGPGFPFTAPSKFSLMYTLGGKCQKTVQLVCKIFIMYTCLVYAILVFVFAVTIPGGEALDLWSARCSIVDIGMSREQGGGRLDRKFVFLKGHIYPGWQSHTRVMPLMAMTVNKDAITKSDAIDVCGPIDTLTFGDAPRVAAAGLLEVLEIVSHCSL